MKYILYIVFIMALSVSGIRLFYDIQNIKEFKKDDIITKHELRERRVFDDLLVCISNIFDVTRLKSTTEMTVQDSDTKKVKIIFDEKLKDPYEYEGKCVGGNMGLYVSKFDTKEEVDRVQVLWVPKFSKPIPKEDK